MIENFSLQDQWLLEHQDREFFELLKRCITFVFSISDQKLRTGTLDIDLNGWAFRYIEHEGKTINYSFHEKKNQYEFCMGGDHGLMSRFQKTPPPIGPTNRLIHYVRGPYASLYLDPERQNVNMGFDVSILRNGTLYNFLLLLPLDDIKWLCVMFKWNEDKADMEINNEGMDIIKDLDGLPEEMRKIIDHIMNN